MSRIVFFETESWEEPIFRQAFATEDITFHPHTISSHPEEDASIFQAEIISPFVYSQLTKEVLAKFPKLKLIATRSTGFDHIDLAYCKENNIVVSNVPAYGVHGVAEHAFALLLALAKKIVPAIQQTQKGNFQTEGLMGFELFGKTLGIIGAGKIGKSVVQIARGFGMNVLVFSHHKEEGLGDATGVTYVTLEELLAQSDIVSLHVPLTAETKHMINMETIQQFKKGSILINTARGNIVQTEALLHGLDQGILSGAGLDVLEGECDLREERELISSEFLKTCDLRTQLMNHMLLRRDNVLVTPHNAFNSKESLDEIMHTTIANIRNFDGGKPENVVSV